MEKVSVYNSTRRGPRSVRLMFAIPSEFVCTKQLEARRERRPPWPRQIITLILPTVKMLSLGCERLPTP